MAVVLQLGRIKAPEIGNLHGRLDGESSDGVGRCYFAAGVADDFERVNIPRSVKTNKCNLYCGAEGLTDGCFIDARFLFILV